MVDDPTAGGAAVADPAAGTATDDAAKAAVAASEKATAEKAAAGKAAADAAAQTPEQKAAAEKAASDKAAADKVADEKAATEKAAAEKLTALHTPPADGKYTLTLPKDATLDAPALERTAAIARSLGLSNDAAQQLVESTNAEITQYLTAEHQKFAATVEQWKTDAANNPALGKTPEERTASIAKGRSVIDAYKKVDPAGGETLTAFLNETGYGNHPALVGLMHWLGRAAGEGPLVLPNAGGGDTGRLPDKDVFYPKGANLTEAEITAG